MIVYKCQGGGKEGCKNPATWRTGTWNMCDDCIKKMLTCHDYEQGLAGEMVYTGFGSTIHTGVREIEESVLKRSDREGFIEMMGIEIMKGDKK